MHVSLKSHASTPSEVISSVEVEVTRSRADVLALRYRLIGDLRRVRIPLPETPARADELWRHTCFEAFVRTDVYWELNFAPSTLWAAYRFNAYRTGMAAAMDIVASRFRAREGELSVEVRGLPDDVWSLGLSAVVEEMDGRISYWALAHPPGKPDFHHPDCFTLELPPPDLS